MHCQQVGRLAQKLEKVCAELLSTDKDGYRAVDYAQLAPVLIEAIKEQQAQTVAAKTEATAAKAQAATGPAHASR